MRAETRRRAMIASAISVFPVPVGLTTTPRPPARSQAWTAASWSGRSAGRLGWSCGQSMIAQGPSAGYTLGPPSARATL